MSKKNRGNVANGENTVIGAGTTINGDIVADSAIMRVDGQVNGAVSTKGDLVVGSSGVINGNVTASSVNLAGRIFGNVDANNKVEIEAKGQIVGDITAKLMAMDETAVIKGNVNMELLDNVASGNKDVVGGAAATDHQKNDSKVEEA